MRCLITSLHMSGTHDQLNSPCLASMETVARRIAQIVKPILVREANHVGPVFVTTKATRVPWTIDPNLRAAVARKTRKELNLENLRGKFTWVPGAGS